jgi:3-oxoacyl-[acyl-carrier protein] reductase
MALQDELSRDGRICDVFQCDLLNVENVKKFSQDLLGRFGTIDTVVLNASSAIDDTDLLDTQSTRINESIAMNLISSLALIQDFLPGMKDQGWGRIIGVSSDVVHVQPTKGWFSYTVGKTVLESLVRQAAIEFGLFGVTSNLVAPGMTDTNFVSNIPARMRQVVAHTTPTRRLANPTDIASAISYLCQSESGHINGQTIRINGGIGV